MSFIKKLAGTGGELTDRAKMKGRKKISDGRIEEIHAQSERMDEQPRNKVDNKTKVNAGKEMDEVKQATGRGIEKRKEGSVPKKQGTGKDRMREKKMTGYILQGWWQCVILHLCACGLLLPSCFIASFGLNRDSFYASPCRHLCR